MPDTVELLSRIVGIIVIDLVLSGDNAIVIGMAAQPLPPHQRRLAVIIGGAGAFILRTLLTVVAAALLAIPAIKLIGGLLLLWIAYKLLETEQHTGGTRPSTTLHGAIGTILLADLIMSLDNVLGVAAASDGNYLLLALGLAVATAIVLLGGGLFAELIDRLSWLPYVGAAVIAWTGAELLQDDPLLGTGDTGLPLRLALDLLVTLVVLALAYVVHRRPSAPPRRTAG